MVFGISVDSPQTLSRYRNDQQFNFSLLSDFNKEVSELYGCLYENFGEMNMKGVSKRASFVIDKKGITRFAEILESAGDLPDFKTIQQKLSVLNWISGKPLGFLRLLPHNL